MSGGFGKIPAKPDFVRVGHSDAQTRELEAWLDDSCLRMREASVELPAAPVHFALHGAGDPTMLVGVMRPSRDAIGRRFPFAVYASLDWRTLQHRWSGLPVAMSPMLQAADEIVVAAGELELEAVRRRVESLWSPSPSDLRESDAICQRVLEQTPWTSLTERVLGTGATLENASYAFRTLKAALARPQGGVECPIDIDVDLFFWLEATRRLVRTDAISFLWVEEPVPRLIVSTGEPSHVVLLALADARRDQSQIWPLRTQRAAALEMAHKAVGPILEPIRGENLETLLQALVKAGEL